MRGHLPQLSLTPPELPSTRMMMPENVDLHFISIWSSSWVTQHDQWSLDHEYSTIILLDVCERNVLCVLSLSHIDRSNFLHRRRVSSSSSPEVEILVHAVWTFPFPLGSRLFFWVLGRFPLPRMLPYQARQSGQVVARSLHLENI